MYARGLIRWGSLMVATAFALHAQPSHAQKVGVASAAQNQVEGVMGGSTRKLGSGATVFHNELVRTGDASLAQLLFLDETTLSVGAKSQVRLDKFVYNPSRAPSSVVMNASKGAFRFVSGSQNSTNYTIDTPSATIGVRGTVFDLLVWPDRTIVILVEGRVIVTAKATRQSYDLYEPGRALIVDLNGRVQGPRTWDATILTIQGNVPFPLFGTNIWPGQRHIEEADSRRYLNDEKNAIQSGGFQGGSIQQACPPGQILSINICIVFPPVFSDVRLKRDIVFLKHLDTGFNLYRYKYLWSDTAYVGVMAQEVDKLMPQAVIHGADGFLRVDYGQLGLALRTWDDWKASSEQ